MNMFGMRWEEIFALLLIAMGPVGITMSYMPIAQALPPEMRRPLARRTILVGFMVALVLMLLGDGVIQGLHLSSAVLFPCAWLGRATSLRRQTSKSRGGLPFHPWRCQH